MRNKFPMPKSLYRRVYMKMSDGGPGFDIDWSNIAALNKLAGKLQMSAPSNVDRGVVGTSANTTAPTTGRSKVFGDIVSGYNAVKPFISNIANSFTKPPYPTAPHLLSSIVLPKVSLDNSRNQIERNTRAQDINATRSLDEQTAAAVRGANLGQKIQGINQVNEQEAAINAQQSAQAANMNLNVDAMNAGAMNQYGDNLVGRQMALQRARSENLANATDKSVAIDNQKAMGKLDLQKLNVLKEIWKQSGVYDRMMERMKKEGMTDPTGIVSQIGNAMGGYIGKKVYAIGGPTDPVPTPNALAAANQQAKAFAIRRGLVSGENTYVGNQIPKFVNEAGQEVGANTPNTLGVHLATQVPNEIKSLQWDSSRNLPYYIDPHTDDMQYVPKDLFYSPRFNPNRGMSKEQIAANSVTKMGAGGSIHIKPSHRGRFTAYKARTGQTTEQALHSSNPHVRAMANFARNASHWHHKAMGGSLSRTKVFC